MRTIYYLVSLLIGQLAAYFGTWHLVKNLKTDVVGSLLLGLPGSEQLVVLIFCFLQAILIPLWLILFRYKNEIYVSKLLAYFRSLARRKIVFDNRVLISIANVFATIVLFAHFSHLLSWLGMSIWLCLLPLGGLAIGFLATVAIRRKFANSRFSTWLSFMPYFYLSGASSAALGIKYLGDGTIIIAPHDVSLAREVADWVVHIDKGVVVEEGEVQESFSNPKQQWTMEFLTRLDAI